MQKGGAPGVSGCIEHTGVLTQLIWEARENKGDLSVVRYHVPEKVKNIIKQYYSRFFIRFTYNKGKIKWQQLEKGIITGDTISVILFSNAIDLIVKSAENKCKGPVIKQV